MPRRAGRGRGKVYSSNTSASGTTSRRTAANSASSLAKESPSLSKQTGSGRNTQNSKGHRGSSRIASRTRTPQPRAPPSAGRGRRPRKETNAFQDPTVYKADDGIVYRPGDYAYVDSQQPELPFHICVINNFKVARKDSVIAEVNWFYRVTELPEAVYLLLMEDRKKGGNAAVFNHPKVKDRELFMAFNKDTHPATLFRGKCYIKELRDINGGLGEYLDNEDSFFYSFGYKPESRRLTLKDEESYVPLSQQAELPVGVARVYSRGGSPDPSYATPSRTGHSSTPESVTPREKLVWDPQLSDDELLMYLRAARSIALHAGVCMTGMLADGYLAASSDETTQHAFDILHTNNNNTEKALQYLIKHPIVSHLVSKKNWTKEDAVLFSKGMRQFGKNFFKIKTQLLPRKEITELVEYYYHWKKTPPAIATRSVRRQRKAANIRMGRLPLKPRELTPDKEYVDLSSCDEDDGVEDCDKNKMKSYYACRHCFTVVGPNWHHAGPDRAILCWDCRIHFKNYGLMRPLTVKREPPEFLYKDFHESLAAQSEESCTPPRTSTSSAQNTPNKKRKTRNSNGTRGTIRPGLRSAKSSYSVKTEYDDDEEAEASESSESSEYDTRMSLNKSKPLQARRSILDNLDENHSKDDKEIPPAKRPKREQMIQDGSVSSKEEDGRLHSGNGGRESSQKSPNGDHSPCQTSTSSVGDEEGVVSSCSSQASPDHTPLPHQFTRVVKDRDSSCARTDLEYSYVPSDEKKIASKPASFIGTGSSAHGGHPSELPTPTANVKVPIITPHAPQLPMGPPPILGFPQVSYVPGTPGSAGPPTFHQEMIKHGNSMEGSVNREREQQQQLYQQWLTTVQQQQQQSQFPHCLPGSSATTHLHPAHGHPTPVTGYAPGGAPHHEQTQQAVSSQQPMIFTFPTQEEMSIRQRLSAVPTQISGAPEHLAILQQGIGHPAMYGPVEGIMSGGRVQEEPQQHADMSAPQFLVPGPMGNMDQLLMVVPQQHQPGVAVSAGPSPVDNPLVEFQRQFDSAMQQVQKDPNLSQHPQVQYLLQQRQVIGYQAQKLQMAGQDPQHINLALQQTLVRMQQEQLLIQQAQQQQQDAQHYMLVQSQGPSAESAPSRSRPGVIVSNK